MSKSPMLGSIPLQIQGDSKELHAREERMASKDANQAQKPYIGSGWMYLATFVAYIGSLTVGLCLAWPSPGLKYLEEDESQPQISWDVYKCGVLLIQGLIASIMPLGALIGALASGPIADWTGRKLALVIYGLPLIIGFVAIGFSKYVALIVAGRFITGIGSGLVSGTAPTYVIEISTPAVRGMLGAMFQVFITIGILLANVLGLVRSLWWTGLSFISAGCGIAFSVLMLLMPESPSWSNKRQGENEARQVLKTIRTADSDVDGELREIADSQKNQQERFLPTAEERAQNRFKWPLILAIGLMCFQQLSGINIVIFYAASIFKSTGSNLGDIESSCIVCAVQVVATVVASLSVDRCGRKMMLYISSTLHCISLLMLVAYYFLEGGGAGEPCSDEIKPTSPPTGTGSNLYILALIALNIYIIGFSLGWGPIPWMMIPEMTPPEFRSFIASLATGINWLLAFTVPLAFKGLQAVMGPQYIYLGHAIICFLSFFFIAWLLPETKGLTVTELARLFD